MSSLSWLQITAIVYASLWVFKMYLVAKDFPFIAKIRIAQGSMQVREGWSTQFYINVMSFFYGLGSGISLAILLVPTLWKERMAFFVPYPKADLEHFAKHDEWVS